ncbi:hypothetical protein CRUP_033162 [Coryphaenoides rupestris]|nr:hypothetical protein CRUP_033162 [Coryphaenoides rupestris]
MCFRTTYRRPGDGVAGTKQTKEKPGGVKKLIDLAREVKGLLPSEAVAAAVTATAAASATASLSQKHRFHTRLNKRPGATATGITDLLVLPVLQLGGVVEHTQHCDDEVEQGQDAVEPQEPVPVSRDSRYMRHAVHSVAAAL